MFPLPSMCFLTCTVAKLGDQDALLMPIVPVASSEDQVVVAYTESRGSRN
jgi:hypothetical protein